MAALLLANLALAFGPWFVRLADTGPVAAGFWRLAIGAPFLTALALAGGARPRPLGPALWWAIGGAGLFFAADIASWHLGILRTTLANATLFGNSATLIFPIYGFLVARAWPSRTQALALALAAAGAGLLLGRSYQLDARNLTGDLLSLAAGILYTGYFILMARARETMAPLSALALSTVASTLPLLMVALALGERVWPAWLGAAGGAGAGQPGGGAGVHDLCARPAAAADRRTRAAGAAGDGGRDRLGALWRAADAARAGRRGAGRGRAGSRPPRASGCARRGEGASGDAGGTMTPETDTDWTLDELRERLAPEIAANAAFDGWGDEALAMAAEAAGVDAGVAKLAFAGGPVEMIDAWFAHVDRAMIAAVPGVATMKVRERIAALVEARFDAVAADREALRRALAVLALPRNVARAARLGWRTVDTIWRAAGDTSTDYNHYTKRAILLGVYGATVSVFLDDESEGFADTRAFLARRIDGIMRFEKAKAGFVKRTENLPSLSRFIGRLRYPAV